MSLLSPPFERALILTGPTGSGKSRLAVKLASSLNAEIVSMDSMALYRRMDIGTAKPTPAERAEVRHHLVDVLEPWESASVAWWLEQATLSCRDIEARGKRPLFVGGTPLYLKTLLLGLFDGPAADAELRERLSVEAEQLGTAGLHARLAQVDAVAAGRIHPNDQRRVIRALEVFTLTGRPISTWQQQWHGEEPLDLGDRCLWLDLPREELYGRINRRVVDMFAAGLVDEVRGLGALPRPLSMEARQALGYKEVFAHLDGCADLAETIVQVQTRSRQYAKQQITWFRHLPGCRPATTELTEQLWRHTIMSV